MGGKTLLLGEEQPETRCRLETALRARGYRVKSAAGGKGVLRLLEDGRRCSAVLLDAGAGLATLREIRLRWPDLPLLALSGAAGPGAPAEVEAAGAASVVSLTAGCEGLCDAVERALGGFRHAPAPPATAEPWLGASADARNLRELARRVASADDPVLIEGETGVGKETMARYIHALSRRYGEPFVKVNCAALPSESAENELFGYVGAVGPEEKPGAFEAARGGAILLDEVGDMELALQARLLEVLQDYKFRRPRSGQTVQVNARVMATTRQDLERAVAEGRFRKDLYYRLYVIGVTISPLRERKEDILPLADYLLRKYCRHDELIPLITSALREDLLSYHWPGNARELGNIMWTLSALGDARLAARQLRARIRGRGANGHAAEMPGLPAGGGIPTLEQLARDTKQAEVQAILSALNTTWWNRRKAAALLGLEYRTLLYMMKKHCIEDRLAEFPQG